MQCGCTAFFSVMRVESTRSRRTSTPKAFHNMNGNSHRTYSDHRSSHTEKRRGAWHRVRILNFHDHTQSEQLSVFTSLENHCIRHPFRKPSQCGKFKDRPCASLTTTNNKQVWRHHEHQFLDWRNERTTWLCGWIRHSNDNSHAKWHACANRARTIRLFLCRRARRE